MSSLAVQGNPEARAMIVGLQEAMVDGIACGYLTEGDCEVKHYFAPGLYVREMLIPAGTRIVGKIHKHAHFNDISRGTVHVFTEFGKETYHAPVRFTSIAGTKRAVYAETETVWTTYHPTEETDLEKIEDEVIAKDYSELNCLSYSEMKGLIS
jgi:hypothetical protein